jgi:hypothetical protein
MRILTELAGRELLWTPSPGQKKTYELRTGEEIAATVRFERSSLATAEVAGASWTFKREGFWHPRVTVRLPGSATDLAVFRPGWSGAGTLDLSPSRQIQWKSASFWRSSWDWQEADGRPLVHFKSRHKWTKMEAEMVIEPPATELAELPLLVTLGWYLLVLLAQDSAAAGATTVAVTSV